MNKFMTKGSIFKKIIQFIWTFLLEYHLYMVIIALFLSILTLYKKQSTEVLFFDNQFIKAKYILALGEEGTLSQNQIEQKQQSFEDTLQEKLLKISRGRTVVKKSSIIAGGRDITQEVCELLELKSCFVYGN